MGTALPLKLNVQERRILGCLLEKAVVTPDQYPLTLNALVQACNQKSSREPVMNLSVGEVGRTARALEDAHLIVREENFRSRVEKFNQRLCNTPFSDYQFEPDEYAVITLLLLRGPQTPGELRSRSGRLHSFTDNGAVVETLDRLAATDRGPLVVRLPMRAGRRDHEYQDCLSGEPEGGLVGPAVASAPAVAPTASPANAGAPALAGGVEASSLATRVDALEAEVAALKSAVAALVSAD